MKTIKIKGLLKIALCAALTVAVGGCSSSGKIPKNIKKEFSKGLSTEELINEWKKNESAITYINDGGSFTITEPLKIPDDIANLAFKTKMSTNNKVSDLAGLLSPMGIFVSIPESEIREKPLVIFDFQGKLGDFLSALGAAYQVSFNWNPGNILTIEKSSLYMVKTPQDKTIADALTKSITNLGATDVNISLEAGAVSYKADYRTHQRVTNFMEYVSSNAALVSMQVAIITVAMDRSKTTGIDWSALNFHLGRVAALDNAATIGSKIDNALDSANNNGSNNNNNGNNSNNNNGNTDTSSGSSGGLANAGIGEDAAAMLVDGSNLKDIQSYSKIGGNQSKLMLSKGDFAIGAVIDYLSTYGKTETTQSLLMKTLSGKEVFMKSAKEVAYIDSVGVSNLTGGGSSNNSNSNSNSNGNNNNGNNNSNLGFGTANVETVDIGLDLKLQPHYQTKSELVTIGVDLKLSSLLSFVNLSAGNQIGTITRPNTQEQEFTDIVKIKAGETVVIGGITYEQKGDNRNAIPIFENIGGAHNAKTVSKNAMIIMIRPTVTVFKKIDSDMQVVRK